MTWDIIQTFLQTVGFPAVCVVGMAYYVKYITDQHHEETQKLNDDHKKETSELVTAINNNTIAIQKLTDYIVMKGSEDD